MERVRVMHEWRAAADEIWAVLDRTAQLQKEIDDQLKESARRHEEMDLQLKETDRLVKESARRQEELTRKQEETDRQMKETDRQMKETDRQLNKRFSDLGQRFGDMVEYMVMPNLVAQFEAMGFTFTRANRTEIKDREHGIFAEVDALLENGDKVMAVEIKTKPTVADIDDHVERMEKLRRYADLRDDKRIYLGAVAGVVFATSGKNYALKKGFYVIEPSGDTFTIIKPEGQYHPREWGPHGKT